MIRCYFFLLLSIFTGMIFAQSKPQQIIFWHSMAGHLGSEVQSLIKTFNQSQSNYTIKAIYKGDYLETLTSYSAAFRAKKAPDIVQVFEVGTPTMLNPKGIIKPVEQLLKEQGMVLPVDDFFPAVRARYSQNNQLVAMPFNISIPVLFYNADLLKELGYDEHNFPRTWDGLEQVAKRIREMGYPCAYTSSYPAWILIESFAALHGITLVDPNKVQANYNQKFMLHHLQRLKKWQQLHYFEYSGRTDEATLLFIGKRCPLFSQSSGVHKWIAGAVPFRVGVAPMPLDTQIAKQRHPNVVGGGAIWVSSTINAKKQQGIALFFSYLASPDTQRQWQVNTGYLPLGVTGSYQPLNALNQTTQLARKELGSTKKEAKTTFYLLNQIRIINNEALEAIFSNIKTPQVALNTAIERANHTLLRFQRNTH